VIIILDAMGGDNAPDATIKGAVKAINQVEATVVLIGKEDVIRAKFKEFYGKEPEEISDRLIVKNATDTIEMEDTPTMAIKHKKDSSMVVGFKMLKEDEGDVFISAGNSGALLTGATLLVGRIKGIDRPALAGILPAYHSQLLLMDSGANTNCKPINLLQFALMSTIYLRNTFGIEKPAIGLLNIGTEETKGNELTKESYLLLKEKSKELGINFVGNVEGREAFSGEIDAIVTDGFTGNIFLKAIEGLGKFVKKSLTENLKKNIFTTIGAIPSMPAIKGFAKSVDYKSYGGALFLGVKKPVVKAHGSSDEILFEFTIKQAEKFVKNQAVPKLIEEFEKINKNKNENNAWHFIINRIIILQSTFKEKEEVYFQMNTEEVFEKVKGIIVEQLGVAEASVTMEASFIDDLGADSLDIVELVMALEEEFDIEIPDADAEKVATVGDVVEYIKENV